MKKLGSIILIVLFSASANTQSWIPVGSGLNYGGYVNTLFVYDSVMYAGGVFISPGNNIAQWNGTKWDSLNSGINNAVDAISFYKGKVYVGGFFTRAGGHSAGCIATWNGSAFINPGIDIEGGGVQVLQVYDSLLYIGGNIFDSVNHTALITQGIVSWDGSIAASMGTSPLSDDVFSMAVYDGFLNIGQGSSGNIITGCIQAWNDRSYYCVGSNSIYGFSSYDYWPTEAAMAVCNNRLFVGGTYNRIGYQYQSNDTANNMEQYNGSIWTKVGSGTNGPVYALVAYKNLLIAGGDFDSAGGVPANNIAVWNGTKWFPIGNGLNGPVYALTVFDSNLYAGGDFTSPGNGIAEYTGLSTLGVNEIEATKGGINVYPNPSGGAVTVSMFSHPELVSGSQIIEVYNVLGKKIYDGMLKQVQHDEIDLSSQPSGVYFYRVIDDSRNILGDGKLIIQK